MQNAQYKPVKQHFFIEGKYYGFGMRELAIVHGYKRQPRSYAFFCIHCGEVWARCQVETADSADKHEKYLVWSIACRKHPSHQYEVAGALTLPLEEPFNSGFPEEVLRWELARHLDHAELYNIERIGYDDDDENDADDGK